MKSLYTINKINSVYFYQENETKVGEVSKGTVLHIGTVTEITDCDDNALFTIKVNKLYRDIFNSGYIKLTVNSIQSLVHYSDSIKSHSFDVRIELHDASRENVSFTVGDTVRVYEQKGDLTSVYIGEIRSIYEGSVDTNTIKIIIDVNTDFISIELLKVNEFYKSNKYYIEPIN